MWNDILGCFCWPRMHGKWHGEFSIPATWKNHLDFCGLRSLREEQYHLLGGRLSQLHGEVEDVRSAFAIEMTGLLERLWLFEFYGFNFHFGLN